MVTFGGFKVLHLLLITGRSGNFLCFYLVLLPRNFVLNHHIKDNIENYLGN